MENARTVVRRRTRRRDVAALVATPLALVGVFALPFAVRRSLVLSYTDPTLADAYVSHFVHLSVGHLAVNLLTYLTVVPTAYCCFLLAGERERFLVSYGCFLTAVPFALSGLSAMSAKPYIGFGFSGVNMAFCGLLPVALVVYSREQFAPGLDLDHAVALFFVGALVVAGLAAPMWSETLVAVALSLGGLLVYGRDALDSVSGLSLAGVYRAYADDPEHAALATVGLLAFVALPFGMFSSAGAGSTGVLNYYIHFLGYCFGFVPSFVTFRLLAAADARTVDA